MNISDLERLSIEAACTRVVNEYANRVDFRDYDAFANLFAEDCYFYIEGSALTSREDIRSRAKKRPVDLLRRHITTNIVIDVIDENSATGVAYFTVYRAPASEGTSEVRNLRPASIGYYKDKFIKTIEGWKFAERIGHFDMKDPEFYP